jgi:hypothetical protein
MNTDPVRNPSPPVFASRPGTPCGMAEAQPATDLRAQGATRHGADGGVEGFVRHLQRGRVGMPTRQYATNLLRRVAGLQVAGDLIPQRGSWSQAARNARCDHAGLGARRGRVGPVAAGHRRSFRAATRRRASPAVSTEFARPRRGRTIQPPGTRRRVEAPLPLPVDHRPFFKTPLRVEVSPATCSPKNVALGF